MAKFQKLIIDNDLVNDSYVRIDTSSMSVLNGKLNAISSSYTITSSYAISSSYSITSSYSETSSYSISSSYSDTASYSIYAETSSWSINSISSISSSWASSSISASYSLTSSYSETSSYAITSSYSETSSYSITSSYSETSSYSISSSYSPTSSYSITSSYSEISSYAITSSYVLDVKDKSISYNKIQDVSPNKLLGRQNTIVGDVQELNIGSNLTLDGTTLKLNYLSPYDVLELTINSNLTYTKSDFNGKNIIVLKHNSIDSVVFLEVNNTGFVENDILIFLISVEYNNLTGIFIDNKAYASSIKCVFNGTNWIVNSISETFSTSLNSTTSSLSYGISSFVNGLNSTTLGIRSFMYTGSSSTNIGVDNITFQNSTTIGTNNYSFFNNTVIGNNNFFERTIVPLQKSSSIVIGNNNYNRNGNPSIGNYIFTVIGNNFDIGYNISGSVLIGSLDITSDINNGVSIGNNLILTDSNSTIIGSSSFIKSSGSVLLGNQSGIEVNSGNSTLVGPRSNILNLSPSSIVFGTLNTIGQNNPKSILFSTSASNISNNSKDNIIFSAGKNITVNSNNNLVFRVDSLQSETLNNKNTIYFGSNNVYKDDTIVFGYNNKVYGDKSIVIGSYNTFINDNVAPTSNNIVFSYSSKITSEYSTVIGYIKDSVFNEICISPNKFLNDNRSIDKNHLSSEGNLKLLIENKVFYNKIVANLNTNSTSKQFLQYGGNSTYTQITMNPYTSSAIIKANFNANKVNSNIFFFGSASYYVYTSEGKNYFQVIEPPSVTRFGTTTENVAWGLETSSGNIRCFASQSTGTFVNYNVTITIIEHSL